MRREGPPSLEGSIFRAVFGAFVLLFAGSIASLIVADLLYVDRESFGEVLRSREIRAAAILSLTTTCASTALSMLFAIPVGYSLSRARFRGKLVVETLVDLPIVFPPLVLGLSLLIFFRTSIGIWIEERGAVFIYERPGIVLAQFFVSASFAIRAAKLAFGAADARQEQVALTLGCSRWGAFRRVALPNARAGLAAGAILAWARAFGIFGPLLVFVGAVRFRTEVLPTTIYLEASVGRIEVALSVALLMIAIASVALSLLRLLGAERLW